LGAPGGLFKKLGNTAAVCHCFAEAVPPATSLHCLPYGKLIL